ncbi:FG-GAP-like repeat-containing protein [Streptomyces zingiberis]|uniref:Esterase n=1 Tax=Streptomyces zingiberis TaxID=2053010 RepID=A0ABX1BNV6_9ACTN|nr:FG-GAP-like repeat-containing protein [Streptomyces zingiberis]NJP99370.1 esterase [Streptomyces zingiberis]
MQKNHRPAAFAVASILLLTTAGLATAPAAQAGVRDSVRAADRNCDFNGDGRDDLLIGAPGGTVNGSKGAGYVTVQYGTASGLTTSGAAVLHQDSPGVPGATEPGDAFGQAVATGDLDGDGYDDAIVGIPQEDIGTISNAGGAVVLWGSRTGLSGSGSVWLESTAPTAGQTFGLGLAAARFTGQGAGDLLAVADRDGVQLFGFEAAREFSLRREDGGGTDGPGTDGRADAAPREPIPRSDALRLPARGDSAGAPALSGASDTGTGAARFSAASTQNIRPRALTTGDYDGDGWADLVVGGVSTGAEPGHGWSMYFAGGSDGLSYRRELRGGPVVASGDINGDGRDDLVTGEPQSPDDAGTTVTGGTVGVYLGSPAGPAGTGGAADPETPPQWWTQDSPGVPGAAERDDRWGADLSLADTNGDGYADLAVGAPGEDIGTVVDAGAVWVFRGSAGGLTTTGIRDVNQDTAGVPGVAEKSDLFGGQVRLADPDGDGRHLLLAAAPGENANDGVVWVLPNSGSTGVTTTGSWTFGAGSVSAPAAAARYGAAIDE